MDRKQLGALIAARLEADTAHLKAQWDASNGSHFLVDDLLEPELAEDMFNRFPPAARMMELKSLREHKHVAAQMNAFDPLLEEIVFGFQDQRVRESMEAITGIRDQLPDTRLYAGGISMMSKGHFLNPHLDNSHNNDRSAYRVLNLLYYVTPAWLPENGGNLELWPEGVEGQPKTLHSKFNRLVVMATNPRSWHSVSPVKVDGVRCCVSNYFFAKEPPGGEPYFNVTSFRGRPEQPMRDAVLQVDAALRSGIRKVFPSGIKPTKHIYKK